MTMLQVYVPMAWFTSLHNENSFHCVFLFLKCVLVVMYPCLEISHGENALFVKLNLRSIKCDIFFLLFAPRSGLRCSIFLLLLVSLSWILALLSVNSDLLFLHYTYAGVVCAQVNKIFLLARCFPRLSHYTSNNCFFLAGSSHLSDKCDVQQRCTQVAKTQCSQDE